MSRAATSEVCQFRADFSTARACRRRRARPHGGRLARMPKDPPPTRWALEPPPDNHPDDLCGIGADLEPGTLLAAYRLGLFPMPVDGELAWWSPAERAVLPLERFHVSRSLGRSRRRYELRVDTAFADVVRGCADPVRPHGWIDGHVIASYTRLHDLGWAHSVEAWDDEGLAGGVYGLALGGLFAAESMFYRRRDASKVALAGLVELLSGAGDPDLRVLDCQWPTPHLSSLGAITISRGEYRRRLTGALELTDPFAGGYDNA
jgi:leucyl/phenylalanyl-tRNA--protein transferase